MKQKNFKFLVSFMALLVSVICMSVIAFADEPSATPGQVSGIKQIDASDASVKISYNAVLGAKGYKIEVSEDGKTWPLSSESYNAEAYISGLSSAKAYYVRVTAYTKYYDDNYDDHYVYGTTSAIHKVVTQPANIQNVKQVSATTNSFTITWDAIPGVTGYKVYQRLDDSNSPVLVATVSTNKATIKNINPKNLYEFDVYAYTKGDSYTAESDYRAYINEYSLRLVPSKLKWKDMPVDVYYKYSETIAFDFKKPAYTDGVEIRAYLYNKNKQVSKMTTTGGYESLKYIKKNTFYKLRAVGYSVINGKKKYGAWSDYMYVAQQPDVQLKQVGTKKQLKVTWDTVKGATNYTLYASTKKDSGYKKITTTKKTSFSLKKIGKTNLKKNKTYYVYVVANKKVGKTTYKSPVSYTFYLKVE